jgi:hypothetical protein
MVWGLATGEAVILTGVPAHVATVSPEPRLWDSRLVVNASRRGQTATLSPAPTSRKA